MEPKNYKDFKFGRKNIQHNERLCDFYSCWSCQGKEPPDRETLNKIKIINKQNHQENSIQTRGKNAAVLKTANTAKEY